MFTILDDSIPQAVQDVLQKLNRRNRLTKKFTVLQTREYGKPNSGKYQIVIYIPDEDKEFWGGYRKRVETQLINAGVCSPNFTTQQELKWRELKQVLNQFFNPLDVQAAVFKDCRNATLHGWIDNLESKLPIVTYLRCKQIIADLGDDLFAQDFKWYFGRAVPEDSHKGLEE